MEIDFDVIPDERKPLEPPIMMEDEDFDDDEDDYSNKDFFIFPSC